MAIISNSLKFTVVKEELQSIKELSQDNPSERDRAIIGKKIYDNYVFIRDNVLQDINGRVENITFLDQQNHKTVKATSLHELLDGVITIEKHKKD